MNRRDFALSLASALALSGPAIASRGEDRPPLEATGRARLILASGTVLPNYIMVLNGSRTLGQNLRKKVPQFDEARSLPGLFDDLSRPPVWRLLAEAVPVGSVHLLRNSLFVVPDGADIRRGRTAILHRDRAFTPHTRLQEINLSNRPERAEVAALPRLGEAWQSASRLVLLVYPTALADGRQAGK